MDDCIFCQIVSGTIKTPLIHESEHAIAFNDINPVAPVHILIIPKRHVRSVAQVTDTTLISDMFLLTQELVKKLDLESKGFRIVTNTGEKAGQSVFHLHFHLLSGRNFSWPPG